MKKILLSTLFMSVTLFANEIYATFDVAENKVSRITPAVSGVIEKVLVEIGDKVKKGETLVILESSTEKEELMLAEKRVALAKRSYEDALSTFNRYKTLKGVIDKERLQSYTFQKDKAQLEVSISQAEYRLKKIALLKRTIKAPFNGVVKKKESEKGDGAVALQTPLVTMCDYPSVKIVLSFDQKYRDEVKVGQVYRFKVDGEEREREAKIMKIYPNADAQSRKISAEILTQDLLPGIFGEGMIITE